MPPRVLALLLLGLLLAGCVVGDRPDEPTTVTPTFEPESVEPAPDPAGGGHDETPDGTEDSGGGGDEDQADARDGEPEAEPSEEPTPTQAPEEGGPTDEPEDPGSTTEPEPAPAPLRSRITDPRGDTESVRLRSPPRYADLVGGTLTRDTEGYRLAIDLDGGAPEQARDGEHTMNVSSFYDLTGDGHVDIEVWANLADGGWDTARYDNRAGTAAFSDDDEIAVDVVDDQLVLEFPLEVLDAAERFRWAVASEWGRYEQLGSATSVRDEMPDEGAPAPFPG